MRIRTMFTPPKNRVRGKVVDFMSTCLCDTIFADAAKGAVEILQKFVRVEFPEDQTCCGQPAFNSGDFTSARRVIRATMRAFPNEDKPIVVPSASCAAMLFHSAKIAFEKESKEEREQVERFGNRVWEFCDFLKNAVGVESLGGELKARIAIHNSCHSIGSQTPIALRDFLSSIKGVELIDYESSQDCCGFGGTFSVSFPNVSSEMGLKKVRAITAKNPDIICSADVSCLMHQKGIAAKNAIHYPAKHCAEVFIEAMKNGGQI